MRIIYRKSLRAHVHILVTSRTNSQLLVDRRILLALGIVMIGLMQISDIL